MASSPYFPPSTLKKMSYLGLTEGDVLDVYYYGERKPLSDGSGSMMIKKYPSYGIEVGLIYTRDSRTYDGYVITAVWKRQRL